MATSPMPMGQNQMAGAPGAPSSEPGDDAGKSSVLITDMGDGTYQVSVMEADQGEAPDPGDAPQTAASIEEALDMAKTMLTQESGEEGQEGAEGEDPDAPMQPDQAKAAWNQMAAKKDKSRMAM